MELTLLIMCGVALLAGKCYSGVIIQQCRNGQLYVAEYRDVNLTCGPCTGFIDWYVDDNSGGDKKYVGQCGKKYCYFDESAAFRLKVNKRNTQSFDSVLHILHFTSNNIDNTSFICECYHRIYSNRGHYYLQSRESCKLLIKENKQPPSENMKGGIIGGVVAAVVAIAIIGTIVTVYIVKRRKGRLCKGKINLRLFPCPSSFCHRKKPTSQSFEVVNRSQTPVIHYVAPSGDIYTIASTTTSGDLDGEYVTVREILENTTPETDMEDNLQTNKEIPDKTETRTTLKPTTKSKPTTGQPRNFCDLSGTVYMNVTEVPTDSGLGVYHIVPWAVIPATPLPDTGEDFEAVLSEEEYNVLFGENSTEQEDQGATYHHLEPN
ncbi:uncharacterized protein LOC112568766 isoform X3 [Pomacea canaliculata]|uniref:uncharacterized protein LOC112568766 isoform X3 n=1 Tax=Pomacea canaliculata TaxID=400727 RepID=UPI000D72951A|nr:uncharacterized protein LOC112568766 isoform X3 [Pomacea canaliculata]